MASTVTGASQEELDIASAIFTLHFGEEGGRAAWQRAFQSHWDGDADSRGAWDEQVRRGLDHLRSLNIRKGVR